MRWLLWMGRRGYQFWIGKIGVKVGSDRYYGYLRSGPSRGDR